MHDTLLTVFTGILALAVLIQCLVFIGIYLSIRKLSHLMESLSADLLRQTENLSAKADQVLTVVKGIAVGMKTVTDKLSDASAIINKTIRGLDAFISESTDTARLEVLRVQDVIDTASRRVDQMFELLHKSVVTPISEVSAVGRALQVAFRMFFHKKKAPSHASLQDEEMFI